MIALLGWTGTLATFAAYVFISRGLLHTASRRYIWMNIVGGVLAGTASTMYGAWPSVASNALWAVIGVHALWSRSAGSRPTVAVRPDQPEPPLEREPLPGGGHDTLRWRTPTAAV